VDLSASNLFANIVFGAIGVGAWRYGKKVDSLGKMLVGVALVGFSWFTPTAAWTWGVGAGLVALLFVA
jgi:hypothetical protein